MRALHVIVLCIFFGLVVCGCEGKKVKEERANAAKKKKETEMGIRVQWLGHASFRISQGNNIIYIDPWKLKESVHDATVVLVSHSHHDHYSVEDIAKVSGPNTKLAGAVDVVTKEKRGEAILPGVTVEVGGVRITGVAAYNPAKPFHPKGNKWVGFVVELGSKRIYYAGDTEVTEEMKALKEIDLALLPVGGTYTTDAVEAAGATKHIQPKEAVPYHWGDIVGKRNDAEKFAELAECKVTVLKTGEMVVLNSE